MSSVRFRAVDQPRGQYTADEFEVTLGLPDSPTDEQIEQVGLEAKAHVYNLLGLKMGFFDTAEEEGRPAAQQLADRFGGEVVNEQPTQGLHVVEEWPTPAYVQRGAYKNATPEFTAWAIDRFSKYPNEFFDNRGDKKGPKSPDIKHKATGLNIWLDRVSA
jgi:hypothetical protein